MVTSKTKIFLLLVSISLASLLIRFYQIGSVPNGITVDEADMGYNAYSILKTGSDVYRRPFPFFFQSLDDYKAGIGIYAAIPSITIFGLTEFSIRIVPAIIGSIIPLLVFIFIKLIYPKSKITSVVAPILTAFAPWNIAISRANLPYIELIFLYILFFITFIWAIFKNRKLMMLAATLAALTLYVYYAAVIYLTPIILTLIIIYKKYLKDHLKVSFFSLILFVVVALPAIVHYSSKESRTRLNAISVLTADITLPTSISEMQDDKLTQIPLSSLYHNRRLVYLNAMLANYFDYFNLDYLFVNSKNIRYFYVNEVGLFYLIELPFFLFGVYRLITRRQNNDLLLLSLLIIGPIPAVITLGSPFPHRGILLLLAIQLISAVGVGSFIEIIKKYRLRFTQYILVACLAIYSLNVYLFLHQYFIHSPKEFSSENNNGAWFSTVRDVIPKIDKDRKKYDKVVFTWSQGKLVPMIYFLFYNQVDPKILQDKASLWTNEPPSYKQIYNQVDNIEFRHIDWENDKELKKTLFIGYPEEFPKNIQAIDKTYLPNGTQHFLLVGTD